jgi:hypothetical protein
MKRSELTTEITTVDSPCNTPSNWGEHYIVIDKTSASETMVGCEFENDDGTRMTADDFKNQLNENDIEGIFKHPDDGGMFYAIGTDGQYIQVSNPDECTDGLLQTFGKWQSFDDETDN